MPSPHQPPSHPFRLFLNIESFSHCKPQEVNKEKRIILGREREQDHFGKALVQRRCSILCISNGFSPRVLGEFQTAFISCKTFLEIINASSFQIYPFNSKVICNFFLSWEEKVRAPSQQFSHINIKLII